MTFISTRFAFQLKTLAISCFSLLASSTIQGQTSDLECFLNAMSADPVKKEPGYATDPQWANKVRRVIQKYGLEALR